MSQTLERESTSDSQEAARHAKMAETAKVAIIDDEPVNIEIVQSYLEEAGYQNFFRTTDATVAIDLIRQERPDAVLLDVIMPEVSGLDILTAMRADEQLRYIPVIILTASSGAETKLKALNLGACEFLAKPVDSSELLLRLRNVLSFKGYQDHLSDLAAAQLDLLDRTFTGAVCMMTEIIESIESPVVDSSEVRKVAENLMEDMGIDSNWSMPLASRLLVVGLPLLTQSQRKVLMEQPISSASHREIFKRLIEISTSLIRRIPRLDPVIDLLDETLNVDGSLSETDSTSRTFATVIVTALYVDLLVRRGGSADKIIEEMQKRFPAIDRTLLASAECLLGVSQDMQVGEAVSTSVLQTVQLKVGMVVASKIYDDRNQLLVAAGRSLTEPMIVRLKQMATSRDISIEVINK